MAGARYTLPLTPGREDTSTSENEPLLETGEYAIVVENGGSLRQRHLVEVFVFTVSIDVYDDTPDNQTRLPYLVRQISETRKIPPICCPQSTGLSRCTKMHISITEDEIPTRSRQDADDEYLYALGLERPVEVSLESTPGGGVARKALSNCANVL